MELGFDLNESYRFSGLLNYGATCYLNSLLQLLFMTREFQSLIFKWKYDETRDGKSEYCIPLQLQILFDKLDISHQMCSPSTLETVNVINAFGWDISQTKIQQDICELRDVLFDSLSECFKKSELAEEINKLYCGKMESKLSSLESQYKTIKIESFNCLHLQLPEGSTNVEYNLKNAIDDYFRETFLYEDNALFDVSLNKNVFASQIKSISEYPKHLTIQLGRFAKHDALKNMLNVTIPNILEIGENLYENYAIVMHVGYTLHSGHYYLYALDESNCWVMFNDEIVKEMDSIYVQNSAEGRLAEDEQAYLIMYRKVEIN